MSRENLLLRFREWLGVVDADDLPPEVSDVIDQTETWILQHTPASDAEALMVLEVILENMKTGLRSDGLDLVGARNLQVWLSRDLTGAGPHPPRRYGELALEG